MNRITIYTYSGHFIVKHGSITTRIDGANIEEVFKYIRRSYE